MSTQSREGVELAIERIVACRTGDGGGVISSSSGEASRGRGTGGGKDDDASRGATAGG